MFPDACELLGFLLTESTRLVEGLVVNPEKMRANLDLGGGIVYSQRVLLALVEKGMAREDAYSVVQAAGLRAWDEGEDFRSLIRGDSRVTALLSDSEVEALFDPAWHLRYIDTTYRRLQIGEEK